MATESDVNASKVRAFDALAKLLDELTGLAAAGRQELEAGKAARDAAVASARASRRQ